MTKSQKKELIVKLLREYLESGGTEESEYLLEIMIKEIYSSGFRTIGQFETASRVIHRVLEDIGKNAINKDIHNWENMEAVMNLVALIDMSQLPD